LAEDDPNGHVNFATFGMDRLADRQRFYNLIVNTKRMDSYTTTLTWRQEYETHFGIFNHDPKDVDKYKPLAAVALHPKEDTFHYSLRYRYYWRFTQYNLADKLKMSYFDFLELPWYETQEIFEAEQRKAQEEMRKAEEARLQEEKNRAAQARTKQPMQQPGIRRQAPYVPSTPRGGRS
jgi:hypothetical protein